MRLDWRTATAEDVAAFVAAARRFAAAHPSGAVRMFVFQLCRGLERAAREAARARWAA